MLVYGDRVRAEGARDKLASIERRVRRAEVLPPGIERHAERLRQFYRG